MGTAIKLETPASLRVEDAAPLVYFGTHAVAYKGPVGDIFPHFRDHSALIRNIIRSIGLVAFPARFLRGADRRHPHE